MKTVIAHLNDLKEPERTSALAALDADMADQQHPTLADALYLGFEWPKSFHGNAYWGAIYDRLETGTYFDAPQQTDEECTRKAKEYMYGAKDSAIFPEDDEERQKYPLAQTDLFFPEADAAFSKFCLLNQQKHSPDSEGVTWAKEKSVGDGSQLRRHLLEFLKAVQDGDYERADKEAEAINFRGRELPQRWFTKMPPFDNL